eukprot:scaffold604461_cov38-Prasinocladus_malaysianus.AAC.1
MDVQLDLHHVRETFGAVRQGWNRSYKAAQLIFGEGPESFAARATVASQHALMYNNMPAPETGYLLNYQQLFQLLRFGRRRDRA